MECDFDRNQRGRELVIVKRLIDNIVGVIEPGTRQSWAIANGFVWQAQTWAATGI